MQHPGHADVLDVEVLAGHLGRDVDARHRLADDRVLARGLRLRPAEREPEPAGLRLDRNRHAEQTTVDELAVGDPPRSVAGRADDAVLDGELACRDAELRRRPGRAAPAARRLRPGGAAGRRGRSSGCPRSAPGRRTCGVAHDHADASERARRAPRRRSARAPSGCPGRARVLPVKAVTVPSAWIASHESSADGSTTAGHVVGASAAQHSRDAPRGRGQADHDDQCAACPSRSRARVNLVLFGGDVMSGRPPFRPSPSAARLIARTMALWVAHRQRCGSSPA